MNFDDLFVATTRKPELERPYGAALTAAQDYYEALMAYAMGNRSPRSVVKDASYRNRLWETVTDTLQPEVFEVWQGENDVVRTALTIIDSWPGLREVSFQMSAECTVEGACIGLLELVFGHLTERVDERLEEFGPAAIYGVTGNDAVNETVNSLFAQWIGTGADLRAAAIKLVQET